MSRGARLNVGMLDDNKEWVQKFSRSQYDYRATALDGSPWHLPFSHRSVIQNISRNPCANVSFRFLREIFVRFSLIPKALKISNSRYNNYLEYHRTQIEHDTKPIYQPFPFICIRIAISLLNNEYKKFPRANNKFFFRYTLYRTRCVPHEARINR